MKPTYEVITDQLQFPEGPIAMLDGSVIVVEIARQTLSRVLPNGEINVIAELGGGPNGAAIGSDGHCYVCNNGGFEWFERQDKLYPGGQAVDYQTGRIERVNIETGEFEVLFSEVDGIKLCGPNDIVFDRQGGFWFTDHGKDRGRNRDRTGVFYANSDLSEVREVLFPMEAPNGIGLSADESELYVAETPTGRLWGFPIESPGVINGPRRDHPNGGRVIKSRNAYYMFDSLAVDSAGGVAVATLFDGGITTLYPDGRDPKFLPMPDRMTTNICFGGDELRTAYITLSSTGQLIAMDWEVPGLPLNFLNT